MYSSRLIRNKEYHGRSVIEVVMIKGNVKIDRKNLISILQSCLVLILVILVALMMVEIGNLKGTARVINYAGLVRGDTQRAVKLEITGTRNDELIAYLDDILSNLTSGEGHYELGKAQGRGLSGKAGQPACLLGAAQGGGRGGQTAWI